LVCLCVFANNYTVYIIIYPSIYTAAAAAVWASDPIRFQYNFSFKSRLLNPNRSTVPIGTQLILMMTTTLYNVYYVTGEKSITTEASASQSTRIVYNNIIVLYNIINVGRCSCVVIRLCPVIHFSNDNTTACLWQEPTNTISDRNNWREIRK